MLGNYTEAEDNAQEVFLKAFRNLRKYQSEVPFGAWLYKIAYHQCIDMICKRKLVKYLPFFYRDDKENKDVDLQIEAGYFDDLRIPNADLTGKVMQILHAEQKTKERFFMKYKVALTAVIGMMLMSSTGYAAVQYQSLTNKDGEVVYETKSAKEMRQLSKEDEARWKAFHELEEKMLKSGEAGLFYLVANNPDHQTNLGTKMTPFQNLSQLRDKITDKSIKIPDSVNGNYKFKQADVFFKNAQEVNPPSPEEKKKLTEKLRKKAEESKQGYAMMPVEMTNQFSNLWVTYQNGEDTIGATITNLSGKSNTTSYIDESVEFKQEKVQVKGVEMLHTEFASSRSHNLTWVYESPDKKKKYVYTINGNMNKVSKESLMKIAESFLNSK